MFKFIHAADIHLDSPLRGLSRYEGAPVEAIRGACRGALSRLVDLAIHEEVRFVLVCGDLYDGDWRDYNTGLHLGQALVPLREANIPVVMIRGNHDAASQITRYLRLPENVKMLSVDRPETFVLEDLGVAIHGRGFATRHVPENMVGTYPQPIPRLLNIGMLHTSCTGADGHDPYAPCTPADLVAREYDYWALGHIHQRQQLRSDPWIVFPGNLQGRHIRETGGKGATLVTVEKGRITEVQHHDLDVFRWSACEVDATGAQDAEEVLERFEAQLRAGVEGADGRPLAMRVLLDGECPAHAWMQSHPERWKNEIRNTANQHGDGRVWVEQVRLRTSSPGESEGGGIDGFELDVLNVVEELCKNQAALDAVRGPFDSLARRLPRQLTEGDGAIGLDDQSLRAFLEEVSHALLSDLATEQSQ